jgi:glycosyltransferase involved in cell wall biosynthesis
VILSVVMPTHDKVELLARTLEALRAQEVDSPWEAVVVDDASTDGTAGLLAREASRWDGRLVVESAATNVGRARARNLGIARAVGTWVLFLDDDILAPPGLLEAHLESLRREPGTGTIGLVRTDPALVDAPHFHYIDSRGAAKIGEGEVPARYFVTQNAAVPREALAQVGGFDSRFAAYGMEDMEIAFRLEEQAGVRFRIVPLPVPLHVHHHTLSAYLSKKRECGATTLPLLAELHPGRISEMRLDWVLEAGAGGDDSASRRAFRWLCERLPAGVGEFLARGWPVTPDHRPRLAAAHARLLDFCVFQAYRLGLTGRHESRRA